MLTGRGIGRLKLMRVVVAAAMACALAGSAWAQDAAGSKKETMMAVDADPGWEVATVRPSDPDDKNQSFDVRGRHIVIENQPVEMMLLVGYGVQKSQIVGAPEWVRTKRFTVDGVPDVDGRAYPWAVSEPDAEAACGAVRDETAP